MSETVSSLPILVGSHRKVSNVGHFEKSPKHNQQGCEQLSELHSQLLDFFHYLIILKYLNNYLSN